MKEIIKNCGFYKKGLDWSAGLSGTWKKGMNFTSVKQKNIKFNGENDIKKVFKNECEIEVKDSSDGISWNSITGQSAGPVIKVGSIFRGLIGNGDKWDIEFEQLWKKLKNEEKRRIKEGFGINSFVKKILKESFEKEWLKGEGEKTKVWETRINDISW
ncbi:hypothetical protein [Mycoplasma parvum]|uniref:Uncharacterized protein n=1 Tax=Mycoplasma parvum str. Indiana TaxID=1403316 RepID=U5NBQ5_9MOLU|nr:hypothetical protein [Mycoplasma parvum]AGX88991.1 hypothetical protein PRV_01145 [Mycoplasma parvum str. Indiana]